MSFIIILSAIFLAQCADIKNKPDYTENRVDRMDLSGFTIEKTGAACGISFDKRVIRMDKNTASYYSSLSEFDKKIYIRLALLDFLKSDVKRKPYMLVHKRDGSFYMESLAHVRLPFKDAFAVIKNFDDYHSWLLKDINVRRGGRGGSYFLEILTMTYRSSGKYWDFLVRVNGVLGGLYTVAFDIEDRLGESPVPSFGMHIRQSSNLAKTMNGYFRFLRLPCDDTFFVGYFYGDTKLHWLLYKVLSVDVVNSQIGERIETMLENINYKAEDIAAQKMREHGIRRR